MKKVKKNNGADFITLPSSVRFLYIVYFFKLLMMLRYLVCCVLFFFSFFGFLASVKSLVQS